MWSTPGRLESVSTLNSRTFNANLVTQGSGMFYNTKPLPEPLLTPSRQLTAQRAAHADTTISCSPSTASL
jgi:hypothetical protein